MKNILFIFLFLSFISKGQNLVPNYSFESYTICPISPGDPLPSPWLMPTNNSTDYYNSCSPKGTTFNVPYASLGFQYAKQGVAFAGFYFLNGGGVGYREYAQIKLLDSLLSGKCYYVEFFVNSDNTNGWASNNVAANFSPNPYTTSGSGAPLNVPLHITKYGNPVIHDTLNWVQVAGIYSAIGNEKYITIGNFKDNSGTTIVTIPSGFAGVGYYFLDAVSVYSVNPSGPFPWSYPNATINFGDSVYIGNEMGGSFNSNWYTLPGPTFVKNAPGFYAKPAVTTTYVVTYTICGVAHSNTLTVTVNGGAGVNQFGVLSSEFVVSPNPNNGLITVEITNKEFVPEDASLKIINVVGEEIKKEKLNSKKQSLDLSELPNGIYFLELVSNGHTVSVNKIIKQ